MATCVARKDVRRVLGEAESRIARDAPSFCSRFLGPGMSLDVCLDVIVLQPWSVGLVKRSLHQNISARVCCSFPYERCLLFGGRVKNVVRRPKSGRLLFRDQQIHYLLSFAYKSVRPLPPIRRTQTQNACAYEVRNDPVAESSRAFFSREWVSGEEGRKEANSANSTLSASLPPTPQTWLRASILLYDFAS